jgi:hypothetical protein
MTIFKKEISRLNLEDLASLKDKQHLVIALWQLLFLEFSKLQEMGCLDFQKMRKHLQKLS